MLEIRVAVAKIARHDTDESGDTIETIERPSGGFSFVLVDSQGSGRGAKTLSNMLATRAISLLKDGARDGAVARAVHDYLYTYRLGQVAATLNILSIDFQSQQLRVARNNRAPFFVLDRQGLRTYNEPSEPIGLNAMTKPVITELPIAAYTYVVMFTDGLLRAGEQYDTDLELDNYLAGWPVAEGRDPNVLTDELLGRAVALDHDQPSDDMSVVTLAVLPSLTNSTIRRLYTVLPFQPNTSAPTQPDKHP